MKISFKKIFPLALILFLSLFMETISCHVGKLILKQLKLSTTDQSFFKTISGATGFITTASYLSMSFFFNIERIIKIVFTFTLGITLFFLFYGIMHYQEFPIPISFLNNFTFLTLEQQSLISKYWLIVMMYGLTSLWPSGMIILLYGYMNEHLDFKSAAKYYPLFGVLGLLLNIFVNPFIVSSCSNFFPTFSTTNTDWNYFYGIVIFLITLSGLLLFLKLFSDKKPFLMTKSCDEKATLSWKYASIVGILVGFSGLIIMISKTVWKFNASFEFPSPAQYTPHLSSYGAYSSIAALLTLGALVFMSFCLEERLGKAWKNFYYAIGLMTLILGSTFFFFFIHDPSISSIVAPRPYQTPMRTITMISAGYQILISSIAYPVILSLKEIAILQIKKETRFRAKLVIDLIFIKGFLLLGSIIINLFILINGSIQESVYHLAIIFFTICILRLFCINYIGKKLPIK